MSRHLSSKALLELAQGIDDGTITDEIIHRLKADPQMVYRGAPRVKENESRIGVVPKGFVLSSQPSYQNPQLVGHSALYVAEALGRSGYYVVCGEKFSRQFEFLPQALCVAQRKPAYFVREEVGGCTTRFVWGEEERLLLNDVRSLSFTDDGMPLLVVYDRSGGSRIDCGDKILVQSSNLIHHPVVSRNVFANVEQASFLQWIVVNGVPGQQFAPHERVEDFLLWGKEPIAVVFSERKHVHQVARGDVRGKPYRLIDNLCVDKDGILLYTALSGDIWILVHGDREIHHPEWGNVHSLKIVEGRILFTTRTREKGEAVVVGTPDSFSLHSLSYYSIDGQLLTLANGAPLYPASRGDGRWFVVWRDGEGKSYDQIFSLHVEGDTIVYGARNGREFFRVTRPIVPEEKQPALPTGSLEPVI